MRQIEEGWAVVNGRPDSGMTVQEFWGAEAEIEARQFVQSRFMLYRGGLNAVKITREVYAPTALEILRTVAGSYQQTGAGMTPDVRNSVAQEGAELGRAFATIIGIGAIADFESLNVIAQVYAEQKGYRDLKVGGAFVGGFISGFQQTAEGPHKRLEGPNT